MKIYRNTKITFFVAQITIYISMLTISTGSMYPMIGIFGSLLVLSAMCPRKPIKSRDINITQFISLLSLFILLYWLATEQPILKQIAQFCKEHNYDYRFIILTFICYMSSVLKQYKEMLNLTPQEFVEYYEPKKKNT